MIPNPSGEKRLVWPLAFLPVLAVFLFYLPLLNNGFVNWDDPWVIQGNLPIHELSFRSLRWMFSSSHLANWIPLTWLSLAVDYAWGGLDPKAYHLTNLFLHMLNTLLVFFLSLRILELIEKRRDWGKSPERPSIVVPASLLTSSLFGLHPLQVESVAWATERSNLLCGLFSLGGLLAYLDYAAGEERKTSKGLVCLGLFSLALMSKPLAIVFPLLLLLLDAWPLDRLSAGDRTKVLLEKAPFFALSLLVGWITLTAQSGAQALEFNAKVQPPFRLMNALHSLAFYLWKMAAPVRLAAYYPFPAEEKLFSAEYLATFFGVLLAAVVSFISRKKRPYFAAAGVYYLLTLLPVLGLLQAGSQAAADRFTYLPSVGVFLLFSAGLAFFLSRWPLVLALLGVFLAGALGVGTARQVGVWKDSITLWQNAMRVCPSERAYKNLTIAFEERQGQEQGREKGVLAAFPASDPKNYLIYYNLALSYEKKGQVEDAIAEMRKAIQMAMNLRETGREPSAKILGQAYFFLGNDLYKKGGFEEALEQMKKAVQADPGNAEAYNYMGYILAEKGVRLDEAEEDLKSALKLQPNNPNYWDSLGLVYYKKGEYEKARRTFEKSVGDLKSMSKENAPVFGHLGDAYLKLGEKEKAVAQWQKALELDPGDKSYTLKISQNR